MLDGGLLYPINQALIELAKPGFRVLIDFEGVELLSSLALSGPFELGICAKDCEGRLAVCNVHPGILEIFEETKLNKLFPICENREQALALLLQ